MYGAWPRQKNEREKETDARKKKKGRKKDTDRWTPVPHVSETA
jgi:hypothetical protein